MQPQLSQPPGHCPAQPPPGLSTHSASPTPHNPLTQHTVLAPQVTCGAQSWGSSQGPSEQRSVTTRCSADPWPTRSERLATCLGGPRATERAWSPRRWLRQRALPGAVTPQTRASRPLCAGHQPRNKPPGLWRLGLWLPRAGKGAERRLGGRGRGLEPLNSRGPGPGTPHLPNPLTD